MNLWPSKFLIPRHSINGEIILVPALYITNDIWRRNRRTASKDFLPKEEILFRESKDFEPTFYKWSPIIKRLWKIRTLAKISTICPIYLHVTSEYFRTIENYLWRRARYFVNLCRSFQQLICAIFQIKKSLFWQFFSFFWTSPKLK